MCVLLINAHYVCECTWLVAAMSEGEEVVVVSASHAENKGRVKEATFYNWKYRQYFKVVEEGDKNLRARCTLYAQNHYPVLEIQPLTLRNIYIRFIKRPIL